MIDHKAIAHSIADGLNGVARATRAVREDPSLND